MIISSFSISFLSFASAFSLSLFLFVFVLSLRIIRINEKKNCIFILENPAAEEVIDQQPKCMVKWDMALAVRIFFIATLVGLVAVALQYWHVLRNALSDSQWLPTAYFRTSGSNYDGLSPTLKLSAWLAENVSDDASPVEIETAVNKSLFWGTYRPNLYFGTRTRNADAVLTGLAWHGLTVPEDLNRINTPV